MRKALLILSLALGGGLLTSFGTAQAVTEVTRQTFYAASGSEDNDDNPDCIIMYWGFSEWPITASLPTLYPQNRAAFAWSIYSGTASMGDANFARYEWTSAAFGGSIVVGGRLATGVPFRRYASQTTGNIEVKARVRINETDRLDNLRIYLSDDSSGGHTSSSSVTGSLADDTWVIVTATFDLSAAPFSNNATENLRVFLEAEGTDDNGEEGLTRFDVEYIAVRQYDD